MTGVLSLNILSTLGIVFFPLFSLDFLRKIGFLKLVQDVDVHRINPLNPDFPSLTGLITGAPGPIVDLGSKQTN